MGEKEHKLSTYADNILLTLSDLVWAGSGGQDEPPAEGAALIPGDSNASTSPVF